MDTLDGRLERIARSAALTAEAGAAAIFMRRDESTIDVVGQFGEAFRALLEKDYVGILDHVAAGSDDYLLIDDAKAAANALSTDSLPLWGGRASRFVMMIPIRGEREEPLGILALADRVPRPGLSAARTYVLMSLASQVADAFRLDAFQRAGQHVAQDNERLRLLESVVTHAKDSILITEAEPIVLPGPRIVYCNAAFTETTGYSAEEVIGRTPRLLQGVDTSAHSRALIGAALAQWKPIEIEILNYRKDGSSFWVELSIAPVADERGWFTHWVSVQRDVTERKLATEVQTRVRVAEASNAALQTLTNELRLALDAAETANIAKSQFLANMSHEIRTPLNGVLGMTQALWLDDLTPIQRDRVTIIRESGRSLLAVLNDVLDLSKIEAGRMELEDVEFDLAVLVQGVCAAFVDQAETLGVAFDLDIDHDARGLWAGDSVRLKQILYNLISNAMKFTADGSVRVSVGLAEDARLRVAVADTGIGIPADKVEDLFSKFYQADSSTTRRFGGTGLGLSICRQLCELMGGVIAVETGVGRGSTFTALLPLRHLSAASQDDPPSTEAEACDLSNPISRLRILVAEDNAVNQMVIRALLDAFGNTPVIVDNGRQAVDAWKAAAFDLIFMDIQMPEMDGLSATRMIRELERESGRPAIPIVAVSANAMTHQVQDYLEIGMDGHIAKPIEIAALAQILERFGAPAGREERQPRSSEDDVRAAS
ncbi:hypothetical protein BZG35_16735 [Brevundimonas sp. LM2]|nr:hypothetical protein BZG35_16735 [Brevundimonas sp. LM2]